MALFRIENLSFSYPEKDNLAISNIDLTINKGEFIAICGKSGSGKSTLLRHLKPTLTPHGNKLGNIIYKDNDIGELNKEEEVKIGYVFQNPDNQIVTDKVWHELAFALENLGYDTGKIRLRVAEMASFFGIENWFYKNTNELSGGEKQILNLASIMAMDPDILVLDEPTSQLDPIASREFLDILKRINEDLGTTVFISEHRLEDVIPISERLVVLEKGIKIFDGDIRESAEVLKNNEIFYSFPSSMQIYNGLENQGSMPINVKEGKSFISNYLKDKTTRNLSVKNIEKTKDIIETKECFYRYERNGEDIVKNLNLKIEKGKIHSILGGNGTGKSTSLFVMSGVYTPYRGKILINGEDIKNAKKKTKILMLPQDPQTIFINNKVLDELYSLNISENKIEEMVDFMELNNLLEYHPYDLSGGEQQKLGLAKILLQEPEILLLDEVTKGLDGYFKDKLGNYFKELANNGTTIVLVSHDVEFCAKYSDRCSLFFDGDAITTEDTRKFFSGNSFYTTKANRIIRDYNSSAITVEDVINICKN